MQYGDKTVRYAVIEKDGHLREVIGASYTDGKSVKMKNNYKEKQPKPLVEIKNNGTTANDITLTDIGTNGSYIVKNNNHYVSAFGKIDSSTVSIPGGETVWTHGQQSDYDDNIVVGNNGQFEVKDWSNCKADALGSAFRNAKCIKIVPDSWPTDEGESTVTKLYRTFAGITLDNIPDWKYTDKVTDIREMLNGTTINGDLKIDSMIENLTSVTTVKKLLNNCTINDYSYTGGEYKFYNLYKQLKKTVADADASACFGGTQYDKDSGTYTDSYKYACRFNYTDPSGATGVVIPPDLIYIPPEWGGFLHRAYGYVVINDADFKDSQITINDVHINWGLANGYKTIKQSNNNWNISTYRDFYLSVYYVLINECDRAGAHHKHYYANSSGTKTFSWGGMNLPKDTEYTLTVMVFLPAPGSTNPPHTENDQIVLNEDGEIDTDYIEVFLAPNAEYRDENGRYVRTGMIPVVTQYDITKCTIAYTSLNQGDENITWTVSDADGVRVDNSSNPPDNYEVVLTSGSTSYTYTVTSAAAPLYSIPAGVCVDGDGNTVTDIPDGTYDISITAYKGDDSCNTSGTITVKNWVKYDNTCEVNAVVDTANKTWTIHVIKDDEDVTSSMADTNSMIVWLYNTDTGERVVPSFYMPSTMYDLTEKNVIDLTKITETPGTYRIDLSQVRSKSGWYFPTSGAISVAETLTIPATGGIPATLKSVPFCGILYDTTSNDSFEFYLTEELTNDILHVGFANINKKPTGAASSWTYTFLGVGTPSGLIYKEKTTLKLNISGVITEKTVWKYVINKTYNNVKYNSFCIGLNSWEVSNRTMVILNESTSNISFCSCDSSYYQADTLVAGATEFKTWYNFSDDGSSYRE